MNSKCDISCTKDLTNATMSTTMNYGIPSVCQEKSPILPTSKLFNKICKCLGIWQCRDGNNKKNNDHHRSCSGFTYATEEIATVQKKDTYLDRKKEAEIEEKISLSSFKVSLKPT